MCHYLYLWCRRQLYRSVLPLPEIEVAQGSIILRNTPKWPTIEARECKHMQLMILETYC